MTAAIAFIAGFIVFAIIVFIGHSWLAGVSGMSREDEIANRWFIGLIVTIVILAMIGLTIYSYG